MPNASAVFHALQEAVILANSVLAHASGSWAVQVGRIVATNGLLLSSHSPWHYRQIGSLSISHKTSYNEHPRACCSLRTSMGTAGFTSSATKERAQPPIWEIIRDKKKKKAQAQEQQRLAARKARRDGSAASQPVTQWVTVIPRTRTQMPSVMSDTPGTTSLAEESGHLQEQHTSQQTLPDAPKVTTSQTDGAAGSHSTSHTPEPLLKRSAGTSSATAARHVWALQPPEFVSALVETTGLQGLARLLRPLLLEESLVQQITSQAWEQQQKLQYKELCRHMAQREHDAGTLVLPVDYTAVIQGEKRKMACGLRGERDPDVQSVDRKDIKHLEVLWGLHTPVNLQGQAAHEAVRKAGGLSKQALTVAFHVLLKHTSNALRPGREFRNKQGTSQDPEVLLALAIRIHAALCSQLTYLAPVMDMKGCAAIAKNLGLLRHIALPPEEAWAALARRVTGPVDVATVDGPRRKLHDSEGKPVPFTQMLHVALIGELLGVACGAAWLHRGPDYLWHALGRQVTNMAASEAYIPFGMQRRNLPCTQFCHSLWALSVGADSIQPDNGTEAGTFAHNRMATYSSLRLTKSEGATLSKTLYDILHRVKPQDVASSRLSLDKLGFPIPSKLEKKLALQAKRPQRPELNKYQRGAFQKMKPAVL